MIYKNESEVGTYVLLPDGSVTEIRYQGAVEQTKRGELEDEQRVRSRVVVKMCAEQVGPHNPHRRGHRRARVR